MTMSEFRETGIEKWDDVRPVVIYFAGERFVVKYKDNYDPILTPMVALVHTYLGNMSLTKNDD